MNIPHLSPLVRLGTMVMLIGAATSLHSAIIRYDASLGSLPTAQGFLFNQGTLGGTWQPPVVTGGVLHQLPTTGLASQYWDYANTPLDFATTPYVLEWRMRVIDSNYVPDGGGAPGYPRYGYTVEMIDGLGHTFSVGISNDRIVINNNEPVNETNSAAVAPFNTRDDFHTYRLTIANGAATLFLDDVSRASLPLGEAVNPGLPNRILFGDGSWQGISETELQYFSLDYGPTAPPQLTIAVSHVSLCWPSLTNRIYHLQYQSPQTGGAWTDLATNLVGTGSVLCTNDAVISGQPHRFYRVVLEP